MALTREFKETLMRRAQRDGKFRRALLKGNPTAENIFSMIKALQDTEEVRLQVKTESTRAA
jgi:hypothetical protein